MRYWKCPPGTSFLTQLAIVLLTIGVSDVAFTAYLHKGHLVLGASVALAGLVCLAIGLTRDYVRINKEREWLFSGGARGIPPVDWPQHERGAEVSG